MRANERAACADYKSDEPDERQLQAIIGLCVRYVHTVLLVRAKEGAGDGLKWHLRAGADFMVETNHVTVKANFKLWKMCLRRAEELLLLRQLKVLQPVK